MDALAIKNLIETKKTLFAPSKRSILGMQGKDAKDFLQRMSTNDLSKLSFKEPLLTCFLNNKGRVIDEVVIFENEANNYYLVSSFPLSTNLMQWLLSFQFVEDFTLEALKNLTCYYAVSKNGPPTSFSVLLREMPEELGINAKLYLVLCEQAPVLMLEESDWQNIRIACKLPEAPSEISDSYMPQNIGLLHTISLTKGCFIGQEVIAKALTYQKNVKSLATFTMPKASYEKARIGMHIQDDKGISGIISSLSPVFSPPFPQGLAIVEKKAQPKAGSDDFLLAEFIF